MDPLATIGTATTAVELFATLILTITFLGRPGDREYGAAALSSAAATAHSVAGLLVLRAVTLPMEVAAGRLAAVGMIVSASAAMATAVVFGGLRERWVSVAVGVQAGLWVVLECARQVAWVRGLPWGAFAVGEALTRHSVRLTMPDYAASVLPVAAATATLAIAANAYLSGQKGAMTVVVGSTVFVATTLNDFGVATGAFATGYLTDVGLAAFAVGVALTPSARYAAGAIELERRTQELRTRTRELRRSYEELRTAQEELVKKEQLAVVGELAAVIAHEVRNPLAIIANAVAGLRRQAISREDHDVLLSILDEETSRLNRLVTDLLRYARPVNVQRSLIALHDLLERALALAHTDAKTIRMELKMEAQEGRMWGDANLLRQVFDNLIDNAIQAMTSGGSLTVKVHAASEEGADGIAVDIIDTGEGMDTQVRSRALDPFFTTRPSGTGLGLAIVDRIVDAHGGHLAIDSRAGEGTTVTVFLPHGSPSEPPPRSRAPKTASDPPMPVRSV